MDLSIIRLLAKVPTLAAYAYKKSVGQPNLYPDNSLNCVENFLRLTFGIPAEPYEVDPEVAKALDVLFVLHADHEQNCSTSTVRVVGSSEANLFAVDLGRHQRAVRPAARRRQRGRARHARGHPRPGRRRQRVRHPGEEQGAWRQADGLRPPGLQELRPARPDRQAAPPTSCSTKLAPNDHLLDLATQLEEVALSDDYFISRKLYPNVDFYTGLIYRAMGFPTEMFTVLFAIGRLPGWIAHYQRDAPRPGHQDRPPAPGLHRPDRARLPGNGQAVRTRPAPHVDCAIDRALAWSIAQSTRSDEAFAV